MYAASKICSCADPVRFCNKVAVVEPVPTRATLARVNLFAPKLSAPEPVIKVLISDRPWNFE